MTNDLRNKTVVCDLSAIPADERSQHVALGKSLLTGSVVAEGDDEVRFEVGVDRFSDVVRFIDNERRCCRHLSFTLEVPARGGNLAFRISGPGVRDELHALVR